MIYTAAERTAIMAAWELLLRAAATYSPQARYDLEAAAAEERPLRNGDQMTARSLVLRAAYQSRRGCNLTPRQLYGLTVGVRMAHMVADVVSANACLRPEVAEDWKGWQDAAELAVEYHTAALAREAAEREGVRA